MAPALLTAVNSTDHIHLIIGSNPLAGARCSRSIEVGARPKLVARPTASIHYGITKRIEEGQVEWIKRSFQDSDLTSLGRGEVDGVVDAVFVTLGGKDALSIHISNLCRRLRIPVNVADAPSLCTFTLLSTYADGPLQIGITTSGKGCKLSSRIRREVAASLPTHLGAAVERLGALKKKLSEDNKLAHVLDDDLDDDDEGQPASFNQLVKPEDIEAARDRRMRWLAQICEYWPLKRLASITDADVDAILASYRNTPSPSSSPTTSPSPLEPTSVSLDARLASARKGIIILAGSGPGSPQLLTIATLTAIRTADVVLADKLVPAPILDLIPRRTPVHIARKFPGNAEAAQNELLALGLDSLEKHKTVLRLKQGDPYLYGRGGEELVWFREKGYKAVVLPGITSALSAPLFAQVPVTMRDVADQVLVCTGTGRKGALPDIPSFRESRTVVFLMALHRLPTLISALTGVGVASDATTSSTSTTKMVAPPATQKLAESSKALWPPSTPVAIIERASCRDQRVIRSTLQHICAAVEELGSRPPGLLVVGKSCEALVKPEGRWSVEEGFDGLDGVGSDVAGLGIEGILGELDLPVHSAPNVDHSV